MNKKLLMFLGVPALTIAAVACEPAPEENTSDAKGPVHKGDPKTDPTNKQQK